MKHAQAGLAMALATFAMAAGSGIQALLYLGSFGVDGRTDGFFVAFALYAAFGIFSQSIRVSSVPLLVGPRPDTTPGELTATLCLIAIPVALATLVLAAPVAQLLAPGLADSDRAVTAAALPLLGVAMILQLLGSGAATVLAVRERFRAVAIAYAFGALAGVVTYVPAARVAGELSLAWSTLATAVVTAGLMALALKRSRHDSPRTSRRLHLGRLARLASVILGRTGVYLVLNAIYPITLAFTSRYGTGDATVLSYAYVFTSYLVAITAFALALSRIADMRRAALVDWRAVLAETVPQGFRYSMLLAAPALAALIAIGGPLLEELVPSSVGPAEVTTLRTFAALLGAWTVAALLVNLLLPVLFALGRARFVNLLALPLLAVHVGVTAVAGSLFGVEGVVGAAAVAPASFAAALLVAGAGRHASVSLALELGRDALRFTIPAALSFGLAAWLGALLATGAFATLIAAIVGTALYAASLRVAAPRQAIVLAGGLRPLATE